MNPDMVREHATLHWSPTLGFELDLDLTIDSVSVRMVRVPVPTDGTERLRATESVELYALDTLFKTQASVGDAAGHMNSVTLRLRTRDDHEVLEIRAQLEDAETGRTTPFQTTVPVRVAEDAPLRGGPCPEEPNEDALDWDDEDTLSRIVVDFEPNTPRTVLPSDDHEGDAAGGEDEGSTISNTGMEALLRALAHSDEETIAAEDDVVDPEGGEEVASPPHDTEALGDALDHARSFLQLLVDNEQLELNTPTVSDALARGASGILDSQTSPEQIAAAFSEWLFTQDDVEELYLDDDSLAGLIAQW